MDLNEKKVKEYKMWLAAFLKYYTAILQLFEDISYGEMIDSDKLKGLLQKETICKRNLLLVKKELGYDDELSFLEDNDFDGFKIEDGQIKGDTSSALQIIRPWYLGFPHQKDVNHYKYEVANLIIALCNREKAV